VVKKERLLGVRAVAHGAGGVSRAYLKILNLPLKMAVMGAGLLASGMVLASDWVSLGKTEDGTSETFVDRASIQVVGNIRGAVFQYLPKPHLDMLGSAWIVKSEQLSEYDCKNNAVHAIKLVIYLEGGGTHTNVLPTAWGSVTAPWDQAALKYLCAWEGE
jgi:hypothetical protein